MKRILILIAALCALSASAQVSDTQKRTPITSDLCYGLYGGVGVISPVGDLSKNFKSGFAFQVGATVGYDKFRVKTELQFAQPSYKNSNIFSAPTETHDGKEYPTQVNGSSSASYFAWDVQVGYQVYQAGKLSITPNVGMYYSKYSWNLNNLTWSKNDQSGEWEGSVKSAQDAKLSNVGFIASVDIDYQLFSRITSTPFLGEGQKRFTSYVRISPFVAYAKYKSVPQVKGCQLGITINYFGLLQSLGF